MRTMVMKTLSAPKRSRPFFGHDDRTRVTDPTQAPWDAIGQLETASGNLCTATLITPQLALTAGHCLLMPPAGKPDKAIALRFVSQKGSGAMRSTALKDGLILSG